MVLVAEYWAYLLTGNNEKQPARSFSPKKDPWCAGVKEIVTPSQSAGGPVDLRFHAMHRQARPPLPPLLALASTSRESFVPPHSLHAEAKG